MTRKQWQILTRKEREAVLAKFCGWERFPEKDDAFRHEYWAQFKDGHFRADTLDYGGELPDYITDLLQVTVSSDSFLAILEK